MVSSLLLDITFIPFDTVELRIRAGRRYHLLYLCDENRLAVSCRERDAQPTRLETRTKESNMCASRWARTKPVGAMKVKAFR